MFDAMVQGLLMMLVPYKVMMMMLGLSIGTVVAILPGVGSTVALSIILPYLLHMEPVAAVAMMMGVMGVMNTADSITAILLGIPGTGGGAATLVEGHPMARKGEAYRALSGAFTASLIGGIIGCVGLGSSIPILGFLVKQFGSPEFLMLSLLGIASVSGLGGGQVIKGLISAGLGLMIAGIGGAALTPYFRYTLGIPYLYDGFPLIVMALGLFGIPEMLELVIRGTPIGGLVPIGTGIWQGVKDCIDNIWLILRCSLIGLYIGVAPGAGASVASWLAYAHAVQSAKNKGGFGKGDVRGLLAPECANNACRGGDLLVTLLFGVPGSITMGAFQATQSWGDLIALMLLGVLGWIMKEAGFGRPPLIVGFVLGGLCERYLGLSIQRYGYPGYGVPG